MEGIPLLEFDHDKSALIEPTMVCGNMTLPEYCVMPFYGSVIEKLRKDGRLEKVCELGSIPVPKEVYKMEHDGRFVIVVCPGVGAPLAAATFEEVIALGCRKFVACGSAGVLKAELKRGAIVIPSSAIRDEGTSFHYLPPSRTVEMDNEVIGKLEAVLKKHHIKYEIGVTWTTDAVYRETKGKIAKRKAEGCLTVEMECSALLAVAKYRNVAFGQYLLAGDDVSGDEWDPRDVFDKSPVHEKIFWLSVEAVLSL